jgi:hypothetical protein
MSDGKNKPELLPMETTDKGVITWPTSFGGHGCEYTITRYPTWSEVSLSGAGRYNDQHPPISCVPIEVLRDIVALYDALPPIPTKKVGGK